MKKHIISLTVLLFFFAFSQGQRPEVEIRGLLNLAASEMDTTSVFIGPKAGWNDDGTFNENTFLGSSAGYANTGGQANTFIGFTAGYSNTGGRFNTFFGYRAGDNNKNGHYNTLIG